MAETVHVCFTIDVERIKEKSPSGGPPSWELAERSARDYCMFLRERGYPVTLFIVPDVAERQASLFRALAADGHECGLHFHPKSWRDNYQQAEQWEELGGYSAEEQESMLRQASSQWAAAIGREPTCFRPGCFSANDWTFPVLASLGFRCGSVSQPERCAPRVCAVWAGADRSVHRAHRAFRPVAGDLDFVEVPVTVDSRRRDHWTGTGDTRFEGCDVEQVLAGAEDHLRWQVENNAPLKHLCFFTHNFVGYDEADPQSRLPILRGVVDRLPEVLAPLDLAPQGRTVSATGEAFLGLVRHDEK